MSNRRKRGLTGVAHKRTLIQILFIVVLGMLLLVLCRGLLPLPTVSLFDGLACPEGKENPEVIERLSQTTFLSSVENVDGYITGGRSKYCKVYARFEIDARELETFLGTTRIQLPLSARNEITFEALQDRLGWNTDPSVTYMYGQGPVSLDYTQSVYIDMRNPNRYIVFMIVEYEGF